MIVFDGQSPITIHERLPVATIIVPTYNGEQFLSRTLGSCLNQTVRDIEVIVVDDASTDNTAGIVADIADERVRYVRLTSNSGGPATPRNVGLQYAKAPFVAFLDHDDVGRPPWIERLVEALGNHPSAGMAWGQFALRDEDGQFRSVAYRDPFRDSGCRTLSPTMLTWTPGTSGLMVRREVFDGIGGFDPKAGSIDDLDFTMRFAEAGRWSVSVVPHILVDYYTHGANLSSAVTAGLFEAARHVFQKHELTLREYRNEHDRVWYRVARLGYALTGSPARAFDGPFGFTRWRLRYWAYVLAQGLGAGREWAALSRARRRFSEWRCKGGWLRTQHASQRWRAGA